VHGTGIKSRHVDRIEFPNRNPSIYSQLVFKKINTPRSHSRKGVISSLNGVRKTTYPHAKE
jgi:hypothetical protein